MNTLLKKILGTLVLLTVGLVNVWAVTSEPTSLLLPRPRQLTLLDGSFALNRSVSITDPTSSVLLASLFSVDVSSSATVTVNLVSASVLGTFDYELADFDNEGYRLQVTDNAITITAVTKTGVIRAAQTLAQLAAATEGASIPAVDITDFPAFKLRGFMHDVGRSFISFTELKKEIDLLSRFKVNVFHWHLTDNQGFRFESKLYPQLNQASSMTRFAGNFYTQAQCTELEAYAAERGMMIIPEIDMPGHSAAFSTAMGFSMSSSEGRAVLKDLLGELAASFPLAPYIHMGADEAGTTAEFVNEMSQYIKETLGRRCIVWNPISGVSISKANLPYIDMTEMWSTAGRKIDGLPNIDCRYNYVNHFDVFADLVGIYKSNIYYAQQGGPELAGAITALWNDRKTPTETDIISQNSLYANALATSERGWLGGGNQYIEEGGTTLPNSGSEFEEFADWERRFLYYKDTWLSDEPIPYVKQTNVHWRITQPFPNGGTAAATFPPETATDDILPDEFDYNGQTFTTSMATGAGIYLRHVWGTQVPAFFAAPQLNTTAYAWTYVYSPTAQTAGALIEFHNYGRSENDQAPDAGKWDRKGSRIWVNDEEVLPPTWTNTGVSINSEVDLQNENFPARAPLVVSLRAGWNKVFIKLPYVNAGGIRLNKWMFTFVLTEADGRKALEGITYSPIKSLDAHVEGIVAAIGDIKTYVNSKCGSAVGLYPASAASSLMATVAEVEATLQTTLSAAEREAQESTLQGAVATFKSSLASVAVNQPTASTAGKDHYYTLVTPLRGNRYVTSTGAGGELAGYTTVTLATVWKFESREDGTWNIVNVQDGSFLAPNSTNNSALSTATTVPATGWTLGKADTDGYVTITSGTCQLNQTNTSSSVLPGGYRLYNWGNGTNSSDTGCQFLVTEMAEADLPFTLSSSALAELAGKEMEVGTTAATTLAPEQWYVMKTVGRNAYLYEKTDDHKLYTQASLPEGTAQEQAKALVRLVADGEGGYFLQTGFGNYFFTLVDGNGGVGGGNNNGTKATKQAAYTIGNIATGFFWLKDVNGVVMDANAGGGTVAGWGTSAPTSTSSNAAWQFFPVELTDAASPEVIEIRYKTDGTFQDGATSGWKDNWTSSSTPALTISSNPTAGFNAGNGYMAPRTFTMQVPVGYNITGYTLTGHSQLNSGGSTTITPSAGGSAKVFAAGAADESLVVSGLSSTSASFTIAASGDGNANFATTSIVVTVEPLSSDPSVSILAENVTVAQGIQTTGQGNTAAPLLRVKVTPFADCTPTQFNVALAGASQMDRVAIYTTTVDQLGADGVTKQKIGEAQAAEGAVTIPVSAPKLTAGTSVYYWVAADVKSSATELASMDAAITGISYTNDYIAANNLETTLLDLTAKGNPSGEMRIYKHQAALWTGSQSQASYYRIPTILCTADGGIAAFADYRYDNTDDLGKPASGHKIDVVMRKSMDNGVTWGEPMTIAAGDGSSDAAYGYGDPAVVRTSSGKLICLMAAGRNGYFAGMQHTGYVESTDNGASWTAPKDIFASINKSGINFQSAFTTAGKGVTFANGRVAFAMNGMVEGTTNEYIIYSDDEGEHWTVAPTPVFNGADESKLEVMNDNSLLLSVRRGGWNSMANRGYNRSTGDASGDGIAAWGTQAIWGDEMNANGCNADILYYNRGTEDASRPDVIFHTLTKNFQGYRRDLRLYMSFNQGETWMEAFQLQPGFAAYSSMQKLANGDLAIIYEDGSLGNQDKMDCYAMNYIVLSSDVINARIDELYDALHTPTATIIAQGETNTSAPWGAWSPASGWANKFTTNALSGFPGVEISAPHNAFNRQSDYGQRDFLIQPSAAGATDVITIKAPAGYLIKSYSLGGHYWTVSEKYTLTSADGSQTAQVNTNSGTPNMLTVEDIYAPSTSFSITSNGTTNNRYACIMQFSVTLTDSYPIELHTVEDESYATIFLPFAVDLGQEAKAYKLAVEGTYAVPTEVGNEVPAEAPVLLRSESGVTALKASVLPSASANLEGNALRGTDVPFTGPAYVLNQVDGVVGFYQLAGTLSARHAYLPREISFDIKGFTLLWNGQPNGLRSTKAPTLGNATIVNLAGQRVAHPQRGIYIADGKKMILGK